jgi:hypothetical protein
MQKPGAPAGDLVLTDRARTQLLAKLGITSAYFDRCPEDLQRMQVNHFARSNPADRGVLLRTVRGGQVRAVLSGAYTPLDDSLIVPLVADLVGDEETTIQIADFGPDHTHLRILFARTDAEVRPGDVVRTGIHISNSEVGLRSVHVDALVFRLVCTNGAVRAEGGGRTSIRHVGNPARLKDHLRGSILEARYVARRMVDDFRRSAAVQLPDPVAVIERHARSHDLTQEQVLLTLAALRRRGDATLFGAVNAFTEAAQRESTMERRYQMERAGTALLEVAR